MNVYTFSGNIGRDAEVRHMQNGTAICSFPVAVSSGYGDNKKTTWVRCALFGKRAEGGLVPHLVKGRQVVISGELTLNEYTNKEGEAKSSLEVRVNELDLVGVSSGGKPQSGADNTQHRDDKPTANNQPDYGDMDDSIPF